MSVHGVKPRVVPIALSSNGESGIVVRITLYDTGRLEWSGSGLTDEITLRGWLDKLREGILEGLRQSEARVSLPPSP